MFVTRVRCGPLSAGLRPLTDAIQKSSLIFENTFNKSGLAFIKSGLAFIKSGLAFWVHTSRPMRVSSQESALNACSPRVGYGTHEPVRVVAAAEGELV